MFTLPKPRRRRACPFVLSRRSLAVPLRSLRRSGVRRGSEGGTPHTCSWYPHRPFSRNQLKTKKPTKFIEIDYGKDRTRPGSIMYPLPRKLSVTVLSKNCFVSAMSAFRPKFSTYTIIMPKLFFGSNFRMSPKSLPNVKSTY